MSKKLLTPVVGEVVDYNHVQVHPYDVETFEKLGYNTPAPKVAIASYELWFTGKEGDIMSWFMANWTHSFVYCALYLLAIVVGQRLMRHRERFDLRWLLVAWSGTLAIGSIMGAIRGVHELAYVFFNRGLYYSVCDPCCFYGIPGFWALTFVLSKVWELGDTAFIVLRKQPLIFLHWFHHITVLVYSWYSYSYHTAPGRWFTIMNMVVHAVMYSYYTLRALRVRVPRPVMMGITTLQLSQMVVGLFINCYAYWLLEKGYQCNVTKDNVYWALIMYFCYFLLFVNYFYHTYIRPPRRGATAAKQVNGTATTTPTAAPAKTTKMNGFHENDSSHLNGYSNGASFQNGHTKKML